MFVGVSEARSDPVWCGRPPECSCITELKVVQCLGIEKFPLLPEDVKSQTRTIVITGDNIVTLPKSLLNRTEFHSLKKINVIMTKIRCVDIEEARIIRRDLDILSACSGLEEETTTPGLKYVSGKPPSGTEQESTANFNGTDTWIDITSARPNELSTKPTALSLISFSAEWITSGVVLSAINLLAILVIILFIVIRYRRQCCKARPMTNVRDMEMLPVTEHPPVPVPVETIGTYSSEESIELYSLPSTTRQHLKRRSVKKEL